jgi:hypothetical protein
MMQLLKPVNTFSQFLDRVLGIAVNSNGYAEAPFGLRNPFGKGLYCSTLSAQLSDSTIIV